MKAGCFRLAPFILFAALSNGVSAADSSSARSDALLQAIKQGGLQLDGTGATFNVLLGEADPYLPALVASKGAARRTFIVPRQASCELKGARFGDGMYRELGEPRSLSISELEADARELRAFSTLSLGRCKSAVRRCAGAGNLCVSMVQAEGSSGFVVLSDGRHASVERMDDWFAQTDEHEITPDFIDTVSKALNVQDARIVGVGRFGVTVETTTGGWLYFLPGDRSAQGLPLRGIPSAVKEIQRRVLARDPASIPRASAVTDHDVRNMYATAGFDRPAWRDFLRAHPALILVQPGEGALP